MSYIYSVSASQVAIIGPQREGTIQEQSSRIIVRCHALKEREGVADSIGRSGSQLGWVEKIVYRDNLLHERSHDTCCFSRLASTCCRLELEGEVDLPNECQRISASSGTCSRFLLSSRSAASRVFSLSRSATKLSVLRLSSDTFSRPFSWTWVATDAPIPALTLLWAPASRL